MKTLKEYFEQIEKKVIAEAEQLTIEPAKQSTQVIKKGTQVIGQVSNPALAATIKSAIGKGEMSLAGKEMKEAEMDESGLQAYLGNKKYGKKGMDALRQAGREGASKEKMAKIRAKYDQLDEIQVDEKAKNPYAIGMAAAKKAAGITKKHATDLPKSVIVKGHEIAKKIKKTDEAEIPHSGPDYGAGLGAGRKDNVLEAKPDFLDLDKDGNKKETMKKAAADKKKKVKESMNTLEAAYHEGKSHGLSKHGYSCRYNEGSEEHKRYHDGFKEGLDECYGLMPNRGLVVSEIETPATVPGMADQAEKEMDEGNAFTAALAKTPKGGKFTVGGETFTDKSNYNAKVDEYAFESLDKQLSDLLKEDAEPVAEGLSVSMSTGQQGSPDSVSVTGTDDEAGKLLAFIKQVGLGGMGGDNPEMSHGEPAVVATVSDYGAPKFSGHDGMSDLLKKVGAGGEDYKDEEGHDHKHAEEGAACNECGMMEAECGCEKNEAVMGEEQTPDQLEADAVSEDDGEGYEQGQESGAQIDSALAASGASKGGATNEDGAEASSVAADAVVSADAAEEEEEAMSESSFVSLFKKLSMIAEEKTEKEDEKAEKAGKKVAKDIEYDDKKDKKEKKLDEWANDAGKDGTEASFERDIEFMTKVIAGGLNKPKSTGQQTIPVLAGDKERTSDGDVTDFKKLAGLGN
jgi:hypothetical protein